MFQHHKRRIYTWTSPGGEYRNQIDFILTKKRWMKCIVNARAYPGVDCGTDHNLVGITSKLRIAKVRKEQGAVRLNLEGLAAEEKRLAYNVLVSNKFNALNLIEDEREPEELFSLLKDTLLSSTEEIVGKARRRRNQVWITDETLDLMDERDRTQI